MSRSDRVDCKRKMAPPSRSQRLESEPLPVDRANPLGLIVNELVNECRQICIPERDRGTVAVTLKRTPGELRLTVADDGKGVNRRHSDSRARRPVEWIPLRDSSAARWRGRAATRGPSCV